jgi:hypothetical protein
VAAATGQTGSGVAPIPTLELDRWETNMLTYGQRHCLAYAQLTPEQALGSTYYDAVRVFYQIADYTGDKAWRNCATMAKRSYRDYYVIPQGGGIPGYWNFSTGLRMDFERTGETLSQTAVFQLSTRVYCSDTYAVEKLESPFRSREVAYCILAYLDAEALGAPERPRRDQTVALALGHIRQWFITKSYRVPSWAPVDGGAPELVGKYHIQPFMVGLTAQALIRYWEVSRDPQVLPAVKAAIDGIWEVAWVPTDQAFWYSNSVADPTQPFPAMAGAPDLNLLIAPAYAWVYSQTGDAKYRERGDQIFAGGVRRAWLGGAKHFNQNYMWSFDYVRWRSGH